MDGQRKVAVVGCHPPVSGPIDSARGEPKLLLTVTQAAQLLSVHRSTVYDLLGRGDLPSVKIGRRRLIYRQSLVDFIIRTETDEPT